MYGEGRVRSIGLSNFAMDRLVDLILDHHLVPAVKHIETPAFHQQISSPQRMAVYHVQGESWGPFAEGRNNIFPKGVLVSIASKHQKSVAQVILRWLIERSIIAIPKSVHKERIRENFNSVDFRLSSENMARIQALDTNQSLVVSPREPAMVERLSRRKPDISEKEQRLGGILCEADGFRGRMTLDMCF